MLEPAERALLPWRTGRTILALKVSGRGGGSVAHEGAHGVHVRKARSALLDKRVELSQGRVEQRVFLLARNVVQEADAIADDARRLERNPKVVVLSVRQKGLHRRLAVRCEIDEPHTNLRIAHLRQQLAASLRACSVGGQRAERACSHTHRSHSPHRQEHHLPLHPALHRFRKWRILFLSSAHPTPLRHPPACGPRAVGLLGNHRAACPVDHALTCAPRPLKCNVQRASFWRSSIFSPSAAPLSPEPGASASAASAPAGDGGTLRPSLPSAKSQV